MKNKICVLLLVLTAVGFSACTVNLGSNANSGASNTSSPTNNNAAVAKTEKSPAADAANNAKDTSTQTEKPANSGQQPERVQFPAGQTVTNLSRSIPADGSVDFVFNARSGQRMQYSVMYDGGSDTDIEAFLTEPGSQDVAGTSAANENNEYMIKTTGDHRITVSNKTGNRVTVNFGLSLK